MFLQCDIRHGMIFRARRSELIHDMTMDVSPGYRDIDRFRGGVEWHKMRSKDFVSEINFIFEKENNDFNGQSITFQSSVKEN